MNATAQCVSYPKSGRTWLRYMLTVMGYGDVLAFHHDGFEFNDGARPAHNYCLASRLKRYRTETRLIYLDRDPRDVIVSLYHQVSGRFRDFFDYRGDISAFIRDDYFGAEVLKGYRSMWGELLKQRPYLHLTYEDLHADTKTTLERVLTYLGKELDQARIADAIRRGHAEEMRKLELSGEFPEPWLKLRHGSPKVRRGLVGAFRNELSIEDIHFLNSTFGING